MEAHEFSDCRSVVGKELVSAAISAAELNSGVKHGRLCQDRARRWRVLESIRHRRPQRQGRPR